jgi:hypothetical protein
MNCPSRRNGHLRIGRALFVRARIRLDSKGFGVSHLNTMATVNLYSEAFKLLVHQLFYSCLSSILSSVAKGVSGG